MKSISCLKAWFIVNESLIPKSTEIPNYTAPDDVYRTARSTDRGMTAMPKAQYLFTGWIFNVEFIRWFGIYISDKAPFLWNIFLWQQPIQYLYRESVSWRNANISLRTGLGGTEMPVYRDYLVRIKKEEVERMHGTLISLVPEYSSNAILKWIEVFKLSNRDGNLAKPNSLPAFHLPKFKTTSRIFIAIGIGTGIFCIFLSYRVRDFWETKEDQTLCF